MAREPGASILRAVLLVALAFASACGGALVDAEYRGEPLFELEGVVNTVGEGASADHELRASIFWILGGRTTTDASELVEQSGVSVAVSFPARFSLEVFEPPFDPVLERVETPYFVGLVLAYEDVDGDRRFSAGELRGGSIDAAVLYAEESLPRALSPTGGALDRGYSLAWLPLPCRAGPSIPIRIEDNCGVPLGAGCERDADCSERGRCLVGTDDYLGTFRSGYCAISFEEGGCVPARGVHEVARAADGSEIGAGYWFADCESDLDCRAGDGYSCFSPEGVCLPGGAIDIDVDPDFAVLPLCWR